MQPFNRTNVINGIVIGLYAAAMAACTALAPAYPTPCFIAASGLSAFGLMLRLPHSAIVLAPPAPPPPASDLHAEHTPLLG